MDTELLVWLVIAGALLFAAFVGWLMSDPRGGRRSSSSSSSSDIAWFIIGSSSGSDCDSGSDGGSCE